MMDFYVDYSCEDNNDTGRTKLSVSDFDTTTIRDVKYAIQAAIQAPVCDQQLFYQGQPVTDDDMTLSRLYFREGDCFKVEFLAAVDITRMTELVDVLRNFAQEIVEKLNRQLPVVNTKEEPDRLRRLLDFLFVLHNNACSATQELEDSFFTPWKCLRTVAQRHFFVQEGGFEAFLEVFKFSRHTYHHDDFNISENSVEATMIPDQQKHLFNECQLYLQSRCLDLLWEFCETHQEQKFLLSKDVFPLAVDALLLQPPLLEDTGHYDIAERIVDINESAFGTFGALVEYDPNIQEEVSKMSPLINKLLFMIDRCQSEPAGYSLYSSQVASNTLFYCTFNVKSAQPLVDCGALEKMLTIMQKLLIVKDSDAPLKYYCCLFLARLRSAPLVKLDEDTCVAIDELIDVFLEQHVPNEISEWEEEMSSVWITMVPLVHLAFAAGKEYYCNQIHGSKCDISASEVVRTFSSKQSEATCIISEVNEADEDDTKELQSSLCLLLNSNCREENNDTSCKSKKIEGHTLSATSENMEIGISVSEDKNCVTGNSRDQFPWPGSPSTQKLGIFSLMHMFSFKENQQLALGENLLPYLVCLSWHLKDDERELLATSLADFHDTSRPPTLKVIAKSVYALVNGLDMVYKL